jgi:phosphatidate cytidylyltransferase
MKTRIVTAAVLVPLLLLFLIVLPIPCTVVLFGVLGAIGAYELLVGTGLVKQLRLVVYAAVFAFCIPLWCYYGMRFDLGLLGVLLFVCLLFTELLVSKAKLPLRNLSMTFVAGTLIPFLLCSVVRIFCGNHGRLLVYIPFVAAFMSDAAAYFVGSAWGKTKLAPVISPKKTVEGAVGGIGGAVVSMMIYCLILQFGFGVQVNYLYGLLYGIVGSLAGMFGDLCFSAIKRQSGIKDYSKLFPGHGGVLDRFDSVIVVAPLMELLLILIPMAV